MSTHKAIDRICVAAIVLSLLLTMLLFQGEALGIQPITQNPGYQSRLFDTSRVHTIDIVIDDWDEFLTTCQSETYSVCNVVIDGESSRNVGIRGKGNTSLSSVSAMGSSRYSLKLEFDHFSDGNSWYGLDKLSLNNLIQDNTMMKDFLCYRMMQEFDVNAPLCSYVFLTVNGEDWGLYLAVEGVEEAFLQRNYGTDHGALYKPDSMSFGGGPGNGQNFQMDDMLNWLDGSGDGQGFQLEELLDRILSRMEDAASGSPGQGGDGTPAGGIDFSEMFSGLTNGDFEGLGGLTGSADVRLQYIDDNPSSYPNIFDNAKTDVTTADRQRLIASLRSLSAYENLESVLDLDTVLRYFVVNNFVVNDDSYTGTMVHNYYLYEKDGRLSMIPWDYNLSFGTFAGGSEGTEAVNDPIDEVLSDRPMQAWIFSDEAYTEWYHQLYEEFLDSVDISGLIEEAYTLITPYVQRDPTKFCSEEEFYTGVETLKTFCTLRTESVRSQLDGTIPSDSNGQTGCGTLIDGSALTLSDMGTMGVMGNMDGMELSGEGLSELIDALQGIKDSLSEGGGLSMESLSGIMNVFRGGTSSQDGAAGPDGAPGGGFGVPGNGLPDGMSFSGGMGFLMQGTSITSIVNGIVLLVVSVLILAGGLVIAVCFRTRRQKSHPKN